MFRRSFFSLLLLTALAGHVAIAQETAPATTYPAPLAKVELQDGDSIVFLGDSITHQRLYTQYVEDFFYTRFPHIRLKIHNAGVGGARAIDALDRFEKDVVAYKPKYVTILLGMNDGTYQAYNEEVFRTYERDMTTLLDKIAESGAKAIPMTPTMFDYRAVLLKPGRRDPAKLQLYNSVLAYYGMFLQEKAYERGLGFVDMYTPLNHITWEQRKTDPNFTLIADAVHPGANGQVVMATALIEGIGLKGPLSSATIRQTPKGKWAATSKGTKVSEITGDEQNLSFTLTADALPWVLPAEAKLGSELTHLGQQFSRESLSVVGLPPGTYRLTIDDIEVGTYGARQLATGIQLQNNEKTPQYQQALKVAELNKKRNEGPIGNLRGEWARFQGYARAKRDNNQENIAKIEPLIQTMDERVAAANAQAKEIEDQIFQINQPQPHKYVLTLVPAEKK